MPEITRLSGSRDWIDPDFVERERTPERAMKLGIRMYVAGLSLSNTIFVLDSLGVERSRNAVHDRVRKADLQPVSGKSPNRIAVDETEIRINDPQFWLYAAANPSKNEIPIYGYFRPLRPLSPKSLPKNCGKSTMSKPASLP